MLAVLNKLMITCLIIKKKKNVDCINFVFINCNHNFYYQYISSSSFFFFFFSDISVSVNISTRCGKACSVPLLPQIVCRSWCLVGLYYAIESSLDFFRKDSNLPEIYATMPTSQQHPH